MQRFLSEDPLGFAGGDLNLHAYVFNSPTNYTDPSGEIVPALIVAGACLAGGLIGAGVVWQGAGRKVDAGDVARGARYGCAAGTVVAAGAIIGAAAMGAMTAGTMATASAAGTAAGGAAARWPSAYQATAQVAGRWYAEISGRLYSAHALERMAPRGFGGRGIPPSVVENAIRYGAQTPGYGGRIVHAYENVRVVTENGTVITVYQRSLP